MGIYYKFASEKMKAMTIPSKVGQVLQKRPDDEMALLVGALRSFHNGGRTVESDEIKLGQANRYLNIIDGKEKSTLGPKDFETIAGLVASFLSGPTK
jgi:hypothetical protein